ncbi:hypothetical protein Tsubulata_045864 [Turnera subulata]|uniref:Uncharacterized protein n=1 Tax=Turnera subulata TaxID=218843 RepID=A0A9Q0F9E6_9ROSI|nr:hypothetical protein Tsubulata_045864 [Turnera subulata]
MISSGAEEQEGEEGMVAAKSFKYRSNDLPDQHGRDDYHSASTFKAAIIWLLIPSWFQGDEKDRCMVDEETFPSYASFQSLHLRTCKEPISKVASVQHFIVSGDIFQLVPEDVKSLDMIFAWLRIVPL